MANAVKNYARAEKNARTATPQTRRTPGRSDEVRNNAGGFTFKVSDRDRLERFLILGTDGGTYYVGERTLTKQNANFVVDLIKRDEGLVLSTLLDVADNNRAAKNSPSLFVLALLFTEGANKAAARAALPRVARTSTHLFEFAQYVDDLGGWGRAKRGAVADWYASKTPESLAYQAVKYRQRNGWTHRDLFRLAHPVGVDRNVGRFILGQDAVDSVEANEQAVIEGFKRMQRAGTAKEVVTVLKEYKNLPWETIPTQFLTDAVVWKTLFYNGALGQTALLRNVTRFAKIGAFNDVVFAGDVAKALADEDRIAKGRVHPVAYANALGIYQNGTPNRGDYYYYGYNQRSKDWTVNAKVLGGLEAGFYASFGAIEPANVPTMLALDISGSMAGPAPSGLVGMNCREASAVMAMVTLRTEPYALVTGFSHRLVELDISDRDSLATVVRKISGLPFGSTDASLPPVYAKNRGLDIDSFVVYTDNETWSGRAKPFQTLKSYRQSSGRDARLAVVGMVGTPFTIADPSDKGMMDFVGFDAAAPRVLADFAAGRI